jgi:O-antigen/teichoic acid export membrane protein
MGSGRLTPEGEAPQQKLPRTSRVTSAGLVRSTFINGLSMLTGVGVTILLTPFMLHRLGASSFGIWALALSLTVGTGYLSLTDLGLQQAAVRFMADARRDDDHAELTGLFSTTLAIFAGIAVVLAGLMIFLAPEVAALFAVHGPLRHAAVITFAIVGAQVIFDLPGLAFRAVLESGQRFAALRGVDLGRSAVFAVLVVVWLLIGRGVVAVAASSAVASFVALCGYIVAVKNEPAARFRRRAIEWGRLRLLLGFSGWLFVLRILSVMYRQMDKLIVGIVLTVSAVATYEVANRIQAALFLVIGIAGSAILPAASLSRLDKPAMRDLFLRATSYSVALFTPICIAACIYAHLLVVGWVGQEQSGATGATRLFAAWAAVGIFDVAGTTMLVAVGRLRIIVALSIVWVTTNLVLSVVFVHIWGITGVVAATMISYVPLLIAYTTISLKEFDIRGSEWLRRVLVPNLPGPMVQIALGLATLHMLERLPPLVGAALGAIVGTVVSVTVYLFAGVRGPERTYLRHTLLRALSRAPG